VTTDLYRRMLPVFVQEAEQKLDALYDAIAILALTPLDAEARRAVARAVHTIKGNAAMLGLAAIADTAERIESRWPIAGGAPTTQALAELHAGRCALRDLIREAANDCQALAGD
jgi:chemosensory pili system protein ChpA (sensor histidine kinase/response regulator)